MCCMTVPDAQEVVRVAPWLLAPVAMVYPVWVGDVLQLSVQPVEVDHAELVPQVIEEAVPVYPLAQVAVRVAPWLLAPDAMV